MSNLFIIGNGFDLAHGMPTKYEDFHQYLLNEYVETQTEELSVPFIVTGHHGEEIQSNEDVVNMMNILINSACRSGENWSDLETTLGNLSLSECFDDIFPFYDKEGDRAFNQERTAKQERCGEISNAFLQFHSYFEDWVQEIPISTKPLENFSKLLRSSNSFFLNFNYTATLEELYHCTHVCHIHGSLENPPLILGHTDDGEYYLSHQPYGLDGELYDVHQTLRKNTEMQMQLHRYFFKQLQSAHINNIYSYGFSFSDVDLPYIQEICSYLNSDCTWFLNDYDSPATRQTYQETLRSAGFKGKFSCFSG